MRMRADECKIVVNKGFSEEWTTGAKPGETIGKPSETGVALLSRYFLFGGNRIYMVFKELIYMDF